MHIWTVDKVVWATSEPLALPMLTFLTKMHDTKMSMLITIYDFFAQHTTMYLKKKYLIIFIYLFRYFVLNRLSRHQQN